MVHTGYIEIRSQGHADIHDVTKSLTTIVEQSHVQDGVLTVFTPSATSALTTIEYESGALDDLRRCLDELAPPDVDYKHNLRWGDGNGHAHLRAALLKPDVSIPIVSGTLTLGTWQQVVFMDFDNRSRQRKLVVQVVGE